MQQIILKKDIDQTQMDALLNLLKSLNIEAEIKTSLIVTKKKSDFSLSTGIWKDYNINAEDLRIQAWNRNK